MASAAGGLSLQRLNGHLSMHLDNGVLPGVNAHGASKILGLLSFSSLPRCLTLNFSDLTSKGLAFDSIGGTSRLSPAWRKRIT
jgi:uncharacterized protein YhdP